MRQGGLTISQGTPSTKVLYPDETVSEVTPEEGAPFGLLLALTWTP